MNDNSGHIASLLAILVTAILLSPLIAIVGVLVYSMFVTAK